MSDTILIALLSPILITLGGLLSWIFKAKREETLNEQAKARQFKIDTYKKLLEPFIATLTFTLPEKQKMREINKLTTLEYRKTVFDLTTFGSDEVLKIFSKIMQTFFHSEEYQKVDSEGVNKHKNRLLILFSELLLQIRKDLYSNRTKLKRADTIEFMLTDIDKFRDEINNYQI